VVADHAAGVSDLADVARGFRPRWEALQAAGRARPFGDPARVAKAAAEVDAWCAAMLAKTDHGGRPLYAPAEAKRLLAGIGEAATSRRWVGHPEAAMQLTWAYVSLRGHGAGAKIPEDKLNSLGQTIPVRVRFPPYSDEKTDEPRPSAAQIAPRLRLMGRFQPEEFTTRFREMSGRQLPK
jgi:hypothetical protein